MRRRAPWLPAWRARSGSPETERVPAAAAGEAEGPPLLRRPGEAVPRLLREGLSPAGDHRREPARAAGVPLGQRARASRLRGLPAPGAPADPARPLDGQRAAR